MDEVQPERREAIQGIVLADALEGGLIAGVISIVAQMVVAAIGGQSVALPWTMASSIILGSTAFAGRFTWGIFIVGFGVHFFLSALFGVVWGAVVNRLPRRTRDNLVVHGALGIAYGFVLWVLMIRVIALIVYPWLVQVPAMTPLLILALAYGLPLAWFVAIRLRPVEKERRRAIRI